MKKCCIENCGKFPVYATGYCSGHQWRFKKYGDPLKTTRNFTKGKTCTFNGCQSKSFCLDLCKKHYSRLKIHGDPSKVLIAPSGSGCTRPDGYRSIYVNKKSVIEHIAVVERILGKKLPKGAVIHHVNEIRTDNRPENLVVCPSNAYHYLIHRRMKALDACGHADWLRCGFCKQYDEPKNIVTIHGTKQEAWYHRECRNKTRRIR